MRRVREWPRLIVAAALLAAVLVLIGVVVASAASSGGGGGGGGSSTNATASTPLLKAPKSDEAVLKSQAATITRLRATEATQKAQITALEQQLKRERALERMKIHARVKHHKQHHANRR